MRKLALALAVCVLSPALAWGQSAENKAAAEALFSEGRRLMEQGHYAEACKKLESSQRLDPGAGTLLNLAACYEANGQTASAWATYKEAAVAAQARHPDWAQQANTKVEVLEPRLSKLTIDVKKQTPGLVVKRDGQTIESTSWGVAIPVDPGAHAIEGSAPGHKAFRTDVTVGKDQDAKSIAIPELEAGESTSSGASSGSGQRIAGIAVMGSGVVGIAVGSIVGAMALGKKSDASMACSPDFKVCSTVGKGLVDDAKSLGLVSTISFIAGGVLIAGGFVLFLTAPKSQTQVQAAFDGTSFSLRGTF